jgi:hypothetical protein
MPLQVLCFIEFAVFSICFKICDCLAEFMRRWKERRHYKNCSNSEFWQKTLNTTTKANFLITSNWLGVSICSDIIICICAWGFIFWWLWYVFIMALGKPSIFWSKGQLWEGNQSQLQIQIAELWETFFHQPAESECEESDEVDMVEGHRHAILCFP